MKCFRMIKNVPAMTNLDMKIQMLALEAVASEVVASAASKIFSVHSSVADDDKTQMRHVKAMTCNSA